MRFWGRIALILSLLPLPAHADAPTRSLRPAMHPARQPEVVPLFLTSLRPRARPSDPNASAALPRLASAVPLTVLPRPRPRPVSAPLPRAEALPAPVDPAPKRERQKKVRGGYVCGDRDILGDPLPPITSNVRGCGVAEPVRVSSVAGVRLRPAATMDCETAGALEKWIRKGMRPSFGNRKIVELRIAADYICRPRNNVKGNKISEHGRGKAIDIAAFVFSDGREWSVAQDYNRQIRKAHKSACGIFGTTLGPGSDGFHEDHLHFDTANSRGGPYCR